MSVRVYGCQYPALVLWFAQNVAGLLAGAGFGEKDRLKKDPDRLRPAKQFVEYSEKRSAMLEGTFKQAPVEAVLLATLRHETY